MNRNAARELTVSIIASVAIAALANPADAILIDAYDRGWWDHTGAHDSINKNTFTGQNRFGTERCNA